MEWKQVRSPEDLETFQSLFENLAEIQKTKIRKEMSDFLDKFDGFVLVRDHQKEIKVSNRKLTGPRRRRRH